MTVNPEVKIRSLTYVAMRSLACVLLKAGVSAREFVEISKAAFVDEATERYGDGGKPASMIAVSRLTGLSRPDVKRLKGKYQQFETTSRVMYTTADGKILSSWFSESRFIDAQGQPIPLAAGPGSGTIAEIATGVGAEEPVESIVKRMLETGHISRFDQDRYVPVVRNYSNSEDLIGVALALDTSIVRSAKTIAHNISADKGATWVQRAVISDTNINEEDLHVIRRATRVKATSFCEEIDDLISATGIRAKSKSNNDNSVKRKAGIGVFYFEDEY